MADIYDSSTRSAIMRNIRSKNTIPEKVVRTLLREAGLIGYRLNRKDLPGKPDIAFGRRRLAIFVHGCFWHGHEGCAKAKIPETNRAKWQDKIACNRSRDAEVVRLLLEDGWRVAIVWQCSLAVRHRTALRQALKEFAESDAPFVEFERKSFDGQEVEKH
jgi:DNA mismatch endonuclease (patch repair protein)